MARSWPWLPGMVSALALVGICVLWVTPAGGQEPRRPGKVEELEQRVDELESVIRQMQAERPMPQPAKREAPEAEVVTTAASSPDVSLPVGFPTPLEAPKPADDGSRAATSPAAPFPAGWKDGFFIQSENRDFVLRITGQVQADYRTFLNDDDVTDIDTFLVRRARLGIEAIMFKYYEFRLLPDFGNGQTRVQDAYMNVRYWDAFQVQVGKFKQPFSYEQLIQDRFVPTMERSMIDQLVPARDEGVMIHGQNLFCKRLDYGIAVSNGEINGDTDTNNRKDFNARLAVRPFNDPEMWPVIQGLQLGMSGGCGVENEPVNPSILRTPATVPWFQYNATVRADGVRSRFSPELAYFYQSFGCAAQYFHQEQQLRPSVISPFRINVPTDGYYFMATYLLTGEERTTYSQAIAPLRPFDPCHPFTCPGAWELVARVSRLDVDDEVFTPGPRRLADPARFSSGATELTVGFNWYLNRWVRTQFNWEHSWFDDPVQLGPTPQNRVRHQDALLTRFQIIF